MTAEPSRRLRRVDLRPVALALALAWLGPLSAKANDHGGMVATSLTETGPQATGSLSGGFGTLVERGGIVLRERAPTRCLPGDLRGVLVDVAARFGGVSIESTHRSRGHNRRAGGARQSLHLSCRAIDFRVRARARGVMAYLRSRPEVGGLKVYRNGIIHIDNGERRRW